MDETIARSRLLVGAAALLCLLVVPIAVAAAADGDFRATASTSVKKKVKKLSTKVKKLQGQVAELEGEQRDPRPPSGQAGGDLAGSYPNPSIAGGAVDANKVLNGSLGTAELASSIPAAYVTHTVSQSIPNASVTTLSFNSERYDTAAMHSNTTNNSRLTAPVDGIYAVTAQVHWGADPDGRRELRLFKNGTTLIADDSAHVDENATFGGEVTVQVRLQAGEFVETQVFQNSGMSGDTLDVLKTSDEFGPEFAMTWLAPGP